MNNPFTLVFLVGMPGCGKTFLGSYAADKLSVGFKDLDQEIVSEQNMSVNDIFQTKGESVFRDMEIAALKAIINSTDVDTIIATGGGTPCFNNAMDLMNDAGKTVWIDASIDTLASNIMHLKGLRPMFNGLTEGQIHAKLKQMYLDRKAFYGKSKTKVTVGKGFNPDLFTNNLLLSTFKK